MQETNEFRHWCVVELFGHQQIAGLVSSQVIGGESFIRIDVPGVGEQQPYSKFYGKGAIYSMSPVDEQIAKAFLRHRHVPPVQPYQLSSPIGAPEEPSVPLGELAESCADPDAETFFERGGPF